ncbi:hypothetical protein [Allokutzneria sp. NRRL B-24872]|uniref:hypothetical protein n=1 Tax=Allokutzneria sp. NRRL B-24872 TaxID=1137961 RepID=UPI000A3A9561|nr:hypothetical protein [Allokutzneria sp. NRRL B-24872]
MRRISKIAMSGVVVASCLLVGSPASASGAVPCLAARDSRGVSLVCSSGVYGVIAVCPLQGPLTGKPKTVKSKVRSDGKVVEANCPTGYYLPKRGNVVYLWGPKKPAPIEI